MRRVLTSTLTVALVVSACGGDSSEPTDSSTTEESGAASDSTTATDAVSTTPADEQDEEQEQTETSGESNIDGLGCTITVTGDLEETIEYPDSQILSDYWSSEDELRDYVEFLGEDIAEGSYEELVARGEPIFGWFILTCFDPQDPGPGVQVFHTNATTSDQFPMGPGTYPVSGGLFDAVGPAGSVITNFALTVEEQFDPVPDSGEMVISRWDTSKLEGVITFDGVESLTEDAPRMVSVVVDFAFECAPTHTGCG
jgi:hypothetical protein